MNIFANFPKAGQCQLFKDNRSNLLVFEVSVDFKFYFRSEF